MSRTISAESRPLLHDLRGQTMGTTWSVRLIADPCVDLHVLHAAVRQVLDRIVVQMSTWEKDSDISRFNRLQADRWQSLPDDFFTVVRCALAIAEASDGAYDPTVGPSVELWGFGAAAQGHRVPAPDAIEAARRHVGWKRLRLDESTRQLHQPGGMHLDLSAIAKGYGVDAVAAHLRGAGIVAALVEVGGELYGYGAKPDGSPWRVLMEASPEEEGGETALEPRVVDLNGSAIATSGDRWHSFQAHGQRYAHTLDPRTGHPVEHAPAAVTVMAATAMEADAWATALTVLGPVAGMALAEQYGLAARFLLRGVRGLEERLSSSMSSRLSA